MVETTYYTVAGLLRNRSEERYRHVYLSEICCHYGFPRKLKGRHTKSLSKSRNHTTVYKLLTETFCHLGSKNRGWLKIPHL